MEPNYSVSTFIGSYTEYSARATILETLAASHLVIGDSQSLLKTMCRLVMIVIKVLSEIKLFLLLFLKSVFRASYKDASRPAESRFLVTSSKAVFAPN